MPLSLNDFVIRVVSLFKFIIASYMVFFVNYRLPDKQGPNIDRCETQKITSTQLFNVESILVFC